MKKLEILEEMAKKLFGTDGVSFQKLITYGSLEELVESNYAPDEEEGKYVKKHFRHKVWYIAISLCTSDLRAEHGLRKDIV